MNEENKELIEFDSTQIQNLNLDFIKKEGVQIYKENNFFKDLHDLMKNPQFKQFYDKYFTNWMDIEVMVMYMKLYDTLQLSYEKKYNKKLDESTLLYVIREVIRNNESRKYVLDNFELFKKGVLKRIKTKNNLFKKNIHYLKQ